MSGKLRTTRLPDVSEENNYRANFASAFATGQFGRKQISGIERLQTREVAGRRNKH
jgi:hypothetical protein